MSDRNEGSRDAQGREPSDSLSTRPLMNKHPVDPFSLILGVALFAGSGLWIAWDQGGTERSDVLIAVPVTLIVAGLAGIVLSAITAHRRKAHHE